MQQLIEYKMIIVYTAIKAKIFLHDILILIREELGNSQMFPDLKQDGKKPVLNAGTESVSGRGCSRMLGTGNLTDFFGKKSGFREMALEDADL